MNLTLEPFGLLRQFRRHTQGLRRPLPDLLGHPSDTAKIRSRSWFETLKFNARLRDVCTQTRHTPVRAISKRTVLFCRVVFCQKVDQSLRGAETARLCFQLVSIVGQFDKGDRFPCALQGIAQGPRLA